MSAKRTKASVEYEDPAKGKDHCWQCVYFYSRGSCKLVEGKIAGGAWCKLFDGPSAAHKSGMRG